VTTEEQLLLQQQRDLEGQSIREAIEGSVHSGSPTFPAAQEEEDDELDLTTLPQYEEYR
jgi:hypothetical protein